MSRPDWARLCDARDHARAARDRLAITVAGDPSTQSDRFLAFVCNLIVIGTTLGKVSDEIKALSDEVPWREVIDTRNRLVHAYWQTDDSIMSVVTAARLDGLVAALDRLSERIGGRAP